MGGRIKNHLVAPLLVHATFLDMPKENIVSPFLVDRCGINSFKRPLLRS